MGNSQTERFYDAIQAGAVLLCRLCCRRVVWSTHPTGPCPKCWGLDEVSMGAGATVWLWMWRGCDGGSNYNAVNLHHASRAGISRGATYADE